MPATALALVVTAALLHALRNIAAKRAGGDHHFAFLCSPVTAVLWLPAAWWFGAAELPRWGWREWGIVCTSAAVHLVYFLTLLRGYRVADLTVVYLVARGSGPLITAAVAVLLLGERLSPVAALGVLAVCGGIFLIAGGPSALRAGAPKTRVRLGLRWGAITGALIAAYSEIDGYAVKFLLMGPVLFDYVCNVMRLPMQAPLVWSEHARLLRVARAQWRTALIVGTFGPLGYILVLYAVTLAPLSHVAPAREVSMFFAALIGGRLLGEADRSWRLAGAGCMALGVAALAVG